MGKPLQDFKGKGSEILKFVFQKIVLTAFGEWIEGEVRLNTGRQVKRLFHKSRKELTGRDLYLSIDNAGMMLRHDDLPAVDSIEPLRLLVE